MDSSETPRGHARLRNRHLAARLVAAAMLAPTGASGESATPVIHAHIEAIRGNEGHIACAAFQPGEGFPVATPPSRAVMVTTPIRDRSAVCVFRDVPPGTYAIAAIHDQNRNGDLDRNWLGIPTEGYGFSANVNAGLGPPSFRVASFAFDGGELSLTIRLQY